MYLQTTPPSSPGPAPVAKPASGLKGSAEPPSATPYLPKGLGTDVIQKGIHALSIKPAQSNPEYKVCVTNTCSQLEGKEKELSFVVSQAWKTYKEADVSAWDSNKTITTKNGITLQKLSCDGHHAHLIKIHSELPMSPFILKIQRGKEENLTQRQQSMAKAECENEARHITLLHRDKKEGHEGIIDCYAAGTCGERSWILIEPGIIDLFEHLGDKEHINTPKLAISTVCHIVEGVAFLHKCKISHNDLKPENVILVAPGSQQRWKIIDFGAARSIEQTLTETRSVGTKEYLAPEANLGYMKLGTRQKLSYGSDIWSTGLTLMDLAKMLENPKLLPAWEEAKKGVKTSYHHPSVKDFHTQHKTEFTHGKTIENWCTEVTGVDFDSYLSFKVPLKPYDVHGARWQIQLYMVGLACLRENPEHRPTAVELQQWSKAAEQSIEDNDRESPRQRRQQQRRSASI